VTFVGDGDTISVRLDAAKEDPPRRIRVSGIQAMEEYVYTTDAAQRRGECQAGCRNSDRLHESFSLHVLINLEAI
jgi:endonuclease YncB( thermonuclease family)